MDTPKSNRPHWKAEEHNPESCQKLRQALRDVKDPELGLDIIQLGMVRDVDIQANQAYIKMILTTPFCPFAPAMLEAAQNKAIQALGMPVQVEMGDEAWDMSMMEDGVGADWGLYR